jgi:hypothetical protein
MTLEDRVLISWCSFETFMDNDLPIPFSPKPVGFSTPFPSIFHLFFLRILYIPVLTGTLKIILPQQTGLEEPFLKTVS